MAIFVFLWAGFCPGRLRFLHFLGLSIVSHQNEKVHTFTHRSEDQDGPKWNLSLTFWMAQPGIFYMADTASRIFLALTQNKAQSKEKGVFPKVNSDLCCETHSPSPVLDVGEKGRMGMLLNWLNLRTNPYVTLLKKERRKKKTSICNRMKSGKMGPKTLCNSKQLWEFWAHKP